MSNKKKNGLVARYFPYFPLSSQLCVPVFLVGNNNLYYNDDDVMQVMSVTLHTPTIKSDVLRAKAYTIYSCQSITIRLLFVLMTPVSFSFMWTRILVCCWRAQNH